MGLITQERWDFHAALDYYQNITGMRIDPASISFYRKFYALVMVSYAHHAGLPIARGTDLMARRCWVSSEVHFVALNRLAHAAGLSVHFNRRAERDLG